MLSFGDDDADEYGSHEDIKAPTKIAQPTLFRQIRISDETQSDFNRKARSINPSAIESRSNQLLNDNMKDPYTEFFSPLPWERAGYLDTLGRKQFQREVQESYKGHMPRRKLLDTFAGMLHIV